MKCVASRTGPARVWRGLGTMFWWTPSNVGEEGSNGVCTRWWGIVWLPACPTSLSAAGEGDGNRAGVLGKELREGELREGDWHLGPARRRVARGNLGEEGVGSGKLGSKDAI